MVLAAGDGRGDAVPAGHATLPIVAAIETPHPDVPSRDPARAASPSGRTRLLRDGLVVAGTVFSAWLLVLHWGEMVRLLGNDGFVYWAVDPANPYADATVGADGAYLYSPAFTLAMTPLRALPREVFFVAWTALIALTALWLGRKWPLAFLPLGLPILQDVMIGNVHTLLAAAIVLGFRWPATWAFVLLTKVTPGVGLLWFLVRREWRSLGFALGATAVIAGVSFLVAPQQWLDWLALLRRDGGAESGSLLIRLVAAAAIVSWGAWTGRAWTVPLAAMLGLPVVWSDSFAMLLGSVALAVDPPATTRQPARSLRTSTAPSSPA